MNPISLRKHLNRQLYFEMKVINNTGEQYAHCVCVYETFTQTSVYKTLWARFAKLGVQV